MKEETIRCGICSTVVDLDDNSELDDETIVCNDCYDDCTCDSCGKTKDWKTTEAANGEFYCSGCLSELFSTCHECGDSILNDDMIYSDRAGSSYCESCYAELFCDCEGCGCVEYINDLHSGLCGECDDECDDEGGEGGRYSNYWHKHGTDSSLFYGIELEVGSPNYCSLKSIFTNMLPSSFFDIHSDCSIISSKFCDEAEIVSHPATYKYLMENKGLWDEVLKSKHQGVRSYITNTCGMHIHLSRNYFSNTHLERFLMMIYGQPSFTFLISQRSYGQLQQWGRLWEKGKRLSQQQIKGKLENSYERYEAVNLTLGQTIELRLFRGTLDRTAFWKNIEYTHALVEFTKITKKSKLTLKNFIKFIVTNKQELPNLYKWVVNRRNKLKDNPTLVNKRAKPIMKHLEVF